MNSIIKAARVIGLGTLASRILGFIRDVIIAGFFGTGMSAQAFVVAFRIPNLLRSIVAEGGTNTAVVPVLSRLHEQGRSAQFWQVANCLLNILLVLLAGLTLLGELFAPLIVRAIAPGFIQDSAKLTLTIRLTRLLFPYILLIGLAAYSMAVLNSLKHFALPALAPCMLNISLIASALIFCPRLKEPVDALVVGVLIGGLLQLLVQVPVLVKKGLFRQRGSSFVPPYCSAGQERLPNRKGKVHPQIKEMGRLLMPRILGMAIYQINLFVDTIFASFTLIVGKGAPAALPYASRIVQFPLALFGLALAQATLPTLSGLAARGEFARFKRTTSFSLRSVWVILVPATLGMMVLARPLVQIIFERGSFSSYSTEITSLALLFYSLGLCGYGARFILVNCFYALKDTFTPAKIAGIALIVNIILNLILMRPFKIAGLALATAISVTVYFILLLFFLEKRLGRLDNFLPSLGKVIFASGVMAVVLWFVFYRGELIFGRLIQPGLKLAVSLFVAIFVYAGIMKVFAPQEARLITRWIFGRR